LEVDDIRIYQPDLLVPGAVEPNPALADQFNVFRPTIGETGMLWATSGASEPLMARMARATSGATGALTTPVRLSFILLSCGFIIANL
jgi:hypothetical protein